MRTCLSDTKRKSKKTKSVLLLKNSFWRCHTECKWHAKFEHSLNPIHCIHFGKFFSVQTIRTTWTFDFRSLSFELLPLLSVHGSMDQFANLSFYITTKNSCCKTGEELARNRQRWNEIMQCNKLFAKYIDFHIPIVREPPWWKRNAYAAIIV